MSCIAPNDPSTVCSVSPVFTTKLDVSILPPLFATCVATFDAVMYLWYLLLGVAGILFDTISMLILC